MSIKYLGNIDCSSCEGSDLAWPLTCLEIMGIWALGIAVLIENQIERKSKMEWTLG